MKHDLHWQTSDTLNIDFSINGSEILLPRSLSPQDVLSLRCYIRARRTISVIFEIPSVRVLVFYRQGGSTNFVASQGSLVYM